MLQAAASQQQRGLKLMEAVAARQQRLLLVAWEAWGLWVVLMEERAAVREKAEGRGIGRAFAWWCALIQE